MKKAYSALAFILFCIVIGLPLFFAVSYARTFLRSANLSFNRAWSIVTIGYAKKADYKDTRVNFFLLGLDSRSDALERTLLTDAMVFASLDLTTGKFTLIPLPRDLWEPELKTKINALYYYATIEKTTMYPYLADTLGTIIGQPIQFIIAMRYNDLPRLVDMLGGIDVTIEEAFVDPQYPNPQYIDATKSSEPVYKTVSFAAGRQHIDGNRALEFVRSRQSANPKEGNDMARSKRQMQVFAGIAAKLTSKEVLFRPDIIGELYSYWNNHVDRSISDEESMGLAFAAYDIRRHIELVSMSLPVWPDDPNGVIFHPAVAKYSQWVYEPVGGDFRKLQDFVKKTIDR